MKPTAPTLSIAAAALAALLLAGCASTPLQDAPVPVTEKSAPATPATTPPAPAADPRAVARVEAAPGTVDPLNDPASPLSRRSVFFDFDQFVVKPEFTPVIEAHGRFLAANKNRRIVVEGNTDDRGSREYNLALGQKRAEAVKQRLTLLGVADSQVEAVSFGEERPRASGATEEAWSQNRRADIVYR
ncbi:MAG: peptidoglycan-associated lipoprotein Pal [Burkholderiales bacterium]|jgi:peptidoglycan-associated lipoprotein|nr:peptidoglycan-associated lipoprotein Pal [Burkholderiales bacterium]